MEMLNIYQKIHASKTKTTNDCCPGSPLKHCGCGVIGPNKIGDYGHPNAPAKFTSRTVYHGYNDRKDPPVRSGDK